MVLVSPGSRPRRPTRGSAPEARQSRCPHEPSLVPHGDHPAPEYALLVIAFRPRRSGERDGALTSRSPTGWRLAAPGRPPRVETDAAPAMRSPGRLRRTAIA